MTALTKDEIIAWAREAGFRVKRFVPPVITAQHSNGSWVSVGDELTAFATLVIQESRKDAENERLKQDNKSFDAANTEMLEIDSKLIAERDALRAENTRLREALEKLARLGNGELYGNSIGNVIARAALGETK